MNKVLVTGATRGIGKAIAEKLFCSGWAVVGTGTSGTADRMSSDPQLAGIEWLDVDLSDPAGVTQFCDELKKSGPFTGLVNNAGVNRIKPLQEVTEEDYEFIHNINQRAPYLISQAVIPGMIESGGGRIVNIASIWSVITKAWRSLYSSAKTGLIGQTRAMAVEFGKDNILVNLVSPGFVLTDMTQQSLSDQEIEALQAQIPAGRMADPSDIAEVVAFLLSQDNRYLTGQNIVVDGGFTSI